MFRLQDLALAKKLAVIVVGLLLPSIWLLFKVVSIQQSTITEADLKLEGLTYMHANWRLSAAIADHRALSAQFFSTKPEEVAVATAKAKIADEVIAEIEKLEATVDDRLRIGVKWKELLERWRKLEDRNSGLDATQYYRQHTALIEMIDGFNGKLARESTLLYEAEAAHYYLIDAVVTNIPRAQNGILALRRAVATGSGTAGVVNPARMELATNVGLVRLNARDMQAEVDRVSELFPSARDSMSEALHGYVAAANRYAQSINDELIMADNREKVLPRIIVEGGAAVKSAIALQDALIPILNRQLKERRSGAVFARNATILAYVVLVGLILMLERMLRKQIDVSAQTVVATMERMANGEVGQRLDITSKDEFGRALAAVNRLDGKLAEVVTVIRKTADKVGVAAREISEGNHELSGRTQSQASALEQTASSMEQMTATVKQNADNAYQASQLASGVRQQAERGSVVVNRATDAMSEINASSAKIADIIGVIDEIAFQTNLLALNAAVEAARAGEQGRGFAVVASEVRNLAQRSADAAKDIKNLIKDSVDKVKVGAELVSESGKTLAEILASVRKVTDIVSEIAAASSEQSAGIDQVNNAVTQMDSVTQENAARVDEASNASKAMQQHTEELLQQISYFKVRNAA